MIVIPAIDIKGGKVVRLTQGKAEQETVYFNSPLEAAKEWIAVGASLIHIVDLDGAIEGNFKNFDLIKELSRNVKAKIELGGGLRDEATIKGALDAGVDKVVLGTKALDEKFLSGMLKKFGDRIVVGIDSKDGYVYTKGWLHESKLKVPDLINKVAYFGVKTINYTDIARDGMLQGPNIDALRAVLLTTMQKNIDVVAAGGVSTIEDVKKLKLLEPEGLKGMIIGKALYEKTIDLKEAIDICSRKE